MILISTCLLNQQRWLMLLLLSLFLLTLASATKPNGDVALLLNLRGFLQTTPMPSPILVVIATMSSHALRLAVVPIADKVLPRASAIYTESGCISNSYNSVPRGGGMWQKRGQNSNIADHESSDERNNNANGSSLREGDGVVVSMPLPRILRIVAKSIIGRTANIIFFRLRQQQIPQTQDTEDNDVNLDHSFDELDIIIGNNTNVAVRQQHEIPPESSSNFDKINNLPSWPKLPGGVSSIAGGWKQRTFRQWINQMERQFLSRETANALKTIRNIIEKFPEYGVVDLFGMYSPKDVILSIVALSRLQQVLETSEPSSTNITDKQLLDELSYYCTFANAAYGWKGFAFCGRLHLGGDYRVLARSTGIDRRDIVTANWSSKANRPAYYIARDVKRKAIVLAIRGSFSPRDLLTDLCASCQNFLVEDELQIGEIGYYRNFTTPRLIFGRAHKGMVDAARTISAMTGKIVTDELEAHPDYNLVIVGHSLGGGVAAIIAAIWHRRFRNRVRSIGYGNPCVFPLNVTRMFDNIITVEVSGDPFATISLGHLADSTKAISKLCQDKGMRDEILKRLDDLQNISRDDFEWCANAMMFLRRQMDSEKLYPPGMIYQVSGLLSDEKKSKGQRVEGLAMLKSTDAKAYSELKLHARMFDVSLHIPMRYEMLLRRLSS